MNIWNTNIFWGLYVAMIYESPMAIYQFHFVAIEWNVLVRTEVSIYDMSST